MNIRNTHIAQEALRQAGVPLNESRCTGNDIVLTQDEAAKLEANKQFKLVDEGTDTKRVLSTLQG